MAKRRLSVRKIKEILRLACEANLSRRQIARSLSVSPTTVGECLKRAGEAGLSWPLPPETDDDALERLLYHEREKAPQRPLADLREVHSELGRKGVTLLLLWEEYREHHPEVHYSYPHFCRLYRDWVKELELCLRQTHKAGERTFVDWAGEGINISDPETGEVCEAPVFVACLGFSSLTFARAYPSMELPHWIKAHTDAFSYFEGVSRILVPDNTKTGVRSACRYEPDLNPTYQEVATHFGCAVIPQRSRKPRDKAKVESGVLQVQRWVLAPLRNRTFFSLAEANQALSERLEILNGRKMKVLEASRRELFERVERKALLPLPQRPYEYAEWKTAKVNIDYHIEVDGHYYSVPYRLVGERVWVRLTSTSVEVTLKGRRVASHPRSFKKGQATTADEHRPASHRAYLEWTPSRIISWAQETGPSTAELTEKIMKEKPHPEMGYRSCLGIIRLSKRYSRQRVEAAAKRALSAGAISYRSIKSILERGLDRLEEGEASPQPLPSHENLRGSDYYN
jgi:transposase